MKYRRIVCAIVLLTFSPLVAWSQQPPDGGRTKPGALQPPTTVRDLDRSKIVGQPPDFISDNPSDRQSVGQVPAAVGQIPGETRRWTSIEIVLSFSVLVFGAMVFALQTWLVVRMPLNWTPNAILRFNGLTLIITGAILLVTAGYSNEQMTPVIGLLGAIAGYLLGSVEKPDEPRQSGRQAEGTSQASESGPDHAK